MHCRIGGHIEKKRGYGLSFFVRDRLCFIDQFKKVLRIVGHCASLWAVSQFKLLYNVFMTASEGR